MKLGHLNWLDSISASQSWGSLVPGRALLGLSNQGANILQNQDRIHARLLGGQDFSLGLRWIGCFHRSKMSQCDESWWLQTTNRTESCHWLGQIKKASLCLWSVRKQAMTMLTTAGTDFFWIEHPFHHVMQIHETFWTSHNFNLNFHLYHHILRNAITTPHRPHLSPPLAVLAQFRLGICEILEAWKHEFSMVLQMVFPTSGSFRVFSMIQNESSGVEWLGWFRTTEVVPFGCSSKSTSSVPIYSISHTSSYDILLVRIIEDLSFCGECCGI